MWNWLVQNKQWVFSGFGAAFVLSILGWLLRTFSRPGEHPANASSQSLNQSPTINVSPTFNVPQSSLKRDEEAIPAPSETSAKLRPNLMCAGIRTTHLGFSNYVWDEFEAGDFAAVATIANRPDEIGAAPVFNVTAQIIFRKDQEEVFHALGAWIGHFSNKADFRPGEQQRLLIAVFDDSDGSVYAIGNKRSAPMPSRARGVIRSLEQSYPTKRILQDDNLDIEITLLSSQGHVLCRFQLNYEKQEDGFKVSPR
jgi:hypothetical protein